MLCVHTINLQDAAKALVWLRCRHEHDHKVQEEIDFHRKEQRNDERKDYFLLKTVCKL